MKSAVDRFPLSWPVGWPRTPNGQRSRAKFGRDVQGEIWKSRQHLTVAQALERLQAELDRIGAQDVILSSNVVLRLDGLPRSGQGEPQDPGVAVYFERRSTRIVFACDRWDRVADNIVALAKTIEAKRGISRWGAVTTEQEFRGYQALPAATELRAGEWWSVLELAPTATLDQVDAAFKRLAIERHPDKPGGSHDAMALLTQARAQARTDIERRRR